jgi:hypothetical protein
MPAAPVRLGTAAAGRRRVFQLVQFPNRVANLRQGCLKSFQKKTASKPGIICRRNLFALKSPALRA